MITLAILRGDYSDASDILTARRHLLSAEEAETIKHRVTQDLLHSRERFWITHGIVRSFAFWSTEEKVNYIREARSVLNVLHDMTDAACFGFGSALACQRDGDLIPHDDDLDIVVAFPKREVGSVQGGIQRIEQFLSQRGLVVSGDFKSHRKVRKKGNKPVDVFVGLIGEDMSVSWFPGPPDGLPYQEVFPPRRAELLGESFPVPARTETYLERVYGVDWRVPKARWSHNWNPGAHANLK